MATFGSTDITGVTSTVSNTGFWRANPATADGYTHTAGAGETLDTISVYCWTDTGTEVNTVAVYDVTSNLPVNLVASGTVTATTTPGWQTTSALSTALVNGTEYVCVVFNASTNNYHVAYVAGTNTTAADQSETAPAPFVDDFPGTNAVYALYATYSSGATITGQPSVVRPSGTGYTLTGTGFGTTFATATVVMNGTTSVSCTITAVTDTVVTFSMPAAPVSLFDATGFTFTFTADDASSDTSAVVPYDPPTTHDFITLTSIAGTDADFTFGYAGATVASGKQVVYETPTLEDSLAIVVSADCSYTLGSPLTQNNTSDYYVIDADGTIGVTDTNTFLFAASSGDSNGGFMSGFGNLGLG